MKGAFYELCQEYGIWIIQYNSKSFGHPVYNVWLTNYTDEDTEDKFIITDTNKIIGAASPIKLLYYLMGLKNDLHDKEKTTEWINKALLVEIDSLLLMK